MDKTKTSKGQKKSLTNTFLKLKGLKRFDTSDDNFKDPKIVREILIDALANNDLETFEDVLIAHLRATSKSKLAEASGLGRQTFYDLMNEKKKFNPTIKTIGGILKALAA
ncbi:MAG: hypothetical protein WCG27_06120 [Pseudomonadota bacterium]